MVQAQDGLAGWLVKSIPQGFLRSLWLSEREQPEGRVSGHPAPATHTAPCQRAKTENKCSAILWIFYHITSSLRLGRYLCLLVWRYRTVNYCSITQSQISLDAIKGIGQWKLKMSFQILMTFFLWNTKDVLKNVCTALFLTMEMDGEKKWKHHRSQLSTICHVTWETYSLNRNENTG